MANLKELKIHHRNVIQMSFNGFSAAEIAARLEMTTATVSRVLRDPLGQAYMNGLTDKLQDATLDVRKELVSMNKDALTTFRRLLDPKQKTPASVQATVAKDILDRSGYKAPDKLNIDMTFQTKTDDEIDAEIEALENAIKKTHKIEPDEPDEPDEPEPESEAEAETVTEHTSSDVDIDEESQEILNDPEFDPFKNIKDSKNE